VNKTAWAYGVISFSLQRAFFCMPVSNDVSRIRCRWSKVYLNRGTGVKGDEVPWSVSPGRFKPPDGGAHQLGLKWLPRPLQQGIDSGLGSDLASQKR
jgi:hypothetical protein